MQHAGKVMTCSGGGWGGCERPILLLNQGAEGDGTSNEGGNNDCGGRRVSGGGVENMSEVLYTSQKALFSDFWEEGSLKPSRY